jgi:hypothetical protein
MFPGFPEPQLEFALASPQDSAEAQPQSLAQKERRFRRILASKKKQSDLAGMAACHICLGDLLLSRGDSEEAGEHYRTALALSRAAHERRQALARP